MPVLTIRDVHDDVKAALEARAKAEGVSQSALARRLLADSLGVTVKKRDFTGLGEELFGKAGLKALADADIDWEAPLFTDEELDEMEKEKDQRIAEGWNKPSPSCR